MKQMDSSGNDEGVEAIFCALERAFFEAGELLAGNGQGGGPGDAESGEREALAAVRPRLVGAALVGCVGCAITVVLSLA